MLFETFLSTFSILIWSQYLKKFHRYINKLSHHKANFKIAKQNNFNKTKTDFGRINDFSVSVQLKFFKHALHGNEIIIF